MPRWSLIACCLLALCVPSSAHAFCRLTTAMPMPGASCSEQGAVLAWRRQCISYSVSARAHDDIPAGRIRDVVDRSFATWNAVRCDGRPIGLRLEPTKEAGACAVPEYNKLASNANTIIFIDDWAERDLPEDAFGVTLVWHDQVTGEIRDADMQLNETLGPLTICEGECPAGAVDLQNLVTHEAGHFLGLGHSRDGEATMSAQAVLGETLKRDLTEDDSRGLCSLYGAFPAASCEPLDFVPDHGASSRCGDSAAAASGTTCSISRIAGHTVPAGAGTAIAGLLTMLGLSRARLRARRKS